MVNDLLMFQLSSIIKAHSDNVYLCGGCVRDLVLGKVPKDYDFLCDGDLSVVQNDLISNGWKAKISKVDNDLKILVVTKSGNLFEIVNFRGNSLLDDALARDFTINAMYMKIDDELVIDPTGKGLDDCREKLIRFVTNPKTVILSDPVRVFRAYRLASSLGFSINKNDLTVIRNLFQYALLNTSPTRIMNEFEKLIVSE